MVTEITIVHNDPLLTKEILNFPYPIYLNMYNTDTKEGKKKGWKIKNEFGAKENPFIVCYNGEEIVKCFYSEADKYILKSLNEFLNE